MFIELTKTAGKGRKVLIDVDKIVYCEEMDTCTDDPYTLIVLDVVIDDELYQTVEVEESVEQIKNKML